MYGCVYGSSNLLAAMECENCLAAAVPAQVHYCRDLESAVNAVPDCPCAPCGDEIVSYVLCALRNATGCAVDASEAVVRIHAEEGGSSPHPPPGVVCEGLGCAAAKPGAPPHVGGGSSSGGGAPRSSAVACQAERQAYASCVESSSSAMDAPTATVACEQCLAGSVPLPGSGASCGDYQVSACSALSIECQSACAKHGCGTQLEAYLGCSFGNMLGSACEIVGCGAAADSANDARNSENDGPCVEQVGALATCLETYEPGTGRVQACPKCVADAFGESDLAEVGCDALEQEVCPALEQCDCGSCGDFVEGYFACVAFSSTESCAGTECNVTAPSPPADDANNSTSGSSAVCNSEFVAIRQCLLVEELGTGLYETCPACVADSFPEGTDAGSVSCDQMNADVCREMKSCDCGSCQMVVAMYFDCVAVMTPASCNEISYDTCFAGPPNVPTSPSSVPSASEPAPSPVAAEPSVEPTATAVPTQGTSPTSAVPTVVTTPAPSGPVSPTLRPSNAPDECSGKEESMQTCLREQLTVAEQDCLNCVDAIDQAINDPLQNCPSVSSFVCTVVTGVCSCGDCTSLVTSYYSCAAAQDGTNCTIDCGVTTQPPASAPSGTSGVRPMTRGFSGLLGWTGIGIVLVNVLSLL